MPLPPLYALRAFEAAARLGSFSKAAELLNVTPGAVSRHIRTLEQWFDCELFRRHGPRVEISATGQVLAAQLGAALAIGGVKEPPDAAGRAGERLDGYR